jgi:hypothetical protein
MTLVDIFEHILNGFDFDSDRINKVLTKAENMVYNAIDKTLDKLNF